MIAWIKTLGTGYLVGAANIIPGVSGGTMALVLGIYKRLITSLRSIDLQLLGSGLALITFRPGSAARMKAEMRRIDAAFLGTLMLGVVLALGSLSKLMDFLLTNYHEATYGFFSGLIVMSIIVPYRHITRRSWREVVSVLVAILLTVGLTCSISDNQKIRKAEAKLARAEAQAEAGDSGESGGLVSLATPSAGEAVALFAAAMLAISCMILPGISGSFVLLLIGVYFRFLQAINDREVVTLAVFALGCLVGLLVFVRFMNWLLERFFNPTLAFMVGLMIGSLYAIWPFKAYEVVGAEKVYLGNILPTAFEGNELLTLASGIVGAAIVAIFCWLDRKTEGEKSLV